MSKKKDTVTQIKGHVKAIATLIVGLGAGEIIGSAVREYKPDAKGLQKIAIKIGAIALTGMVVKAVSNYVESEIDEAFQAGEDIYTQIKLAAEKPEHTTDDEGMCQDDSDD